MRDLPVASRFTRDGQAAAVDAVAKETFLASPPTLPDPAPGCCAPDRARAHSRPGGAPHRLDGESLGPLLRDLSTAYFGLHEGRARMVSRCPVQYADYTLWQQDVLGDESDPDSLAARQLAYGATRWSIWRSRWRCPPTAPGRRDDEPPTATPSSSPVDAGLLAAVERLAAQQDTTVSMVTHSALAVLLHHLGCGDDVLHRRAHRGPHRRGTARPVGSFVNTWVLRVDLSGNPTFRAAARGCGTGPSARTTTRTCRSSGSWSCSTWTGPPPTTRSSR
ncbi:condensation domain-containing protein [Streptomyces sp. KL116D]|uniref:condensation domain-containing protein n=1 Tax=Streptomyces sp. KL116D TaxID=3045152 RepID=UPI003556EDEE